MHKISYFIENYCPMCLHRGLLFISSKSILLSERFSRSTMLFWFPDEKNWFESCCVIRFPLQLGSAWPARNLCNDSWKTHCCISIFVGSEPQIGCSFALLRAKKISSTKKQPHLPTPISLHHIYLDPTSSTSYNYITVAVTNGFPRIILSTWIKVFRLVNWKKLIFMCLLPFFILAQVIYVVRLSAV